ncbi:hypothetical protein Tco_0342452, partial [Tanacetum coccineum]
MWLTTHFIGNKSVDMSGKYGTSNAGAESVGVSDCNKVYKDQRAFGPMVWRFYPPRQGLMFES